MLLIRPRRIAAVARASVLVVCAASTAYTQAPLAVPAPLRKTGPAFHADRAFRPPNKEKSRQWP